MKKLISILLAAVLFCGILSGCNTSVSSTADTQNNDQNSVKSSQEEPITIRIGASITHRLGCIPEKLHHWKI